MYEVARKKRKEKITPVFSHEHDYEPVGLILIMRLLHKYITNLLHGRWVLNDCFLRLAHFSWDMKDEISK